jgi:hypothetical protein
MRDICEMKAHAQKAVNRVGEKAAEAADEVG